MKETEKKNEKIKCPICQYQLEAIDKECPCCGFKEIHKEFDSSQEKKKWEEKVILPLKVLWQSSQKMYGEVVKRYERKKEQYMELCDRYNQLARDYNDLKANFATLKEISPDKKPSKNNPKPGWNTKGIISFKNFNASWWSVYTQCEITNVAINTLGSVADINFLAKKVYDKEGLKATNVISFKWRLKNSNGLVVKNGAWSESSLMVGDITEGHIRINGINSLDKYVLEFLDN